MQATLPSSVSTRGRFLRQSSVGEFGQFGGQPEHSNGSAGEWGWDEIDEWVERECVSVGNDLRMDTFGQFGQLEHSNSTGGRGAGMRRVSKSKYM